MDAFWQNHLTLFFSSTDPWSNGFYYYRKGQVASLGTVPSSPFTSPEENKPNKQHQIPGAIEEIRAIIKDLKNGSMITPTMCP